MELLVLGHFDGVGGVVEHEREERLTAVVAVEVGQEVAVNAQVTLVGRVAGGVDVEPFHVSEEHLGERWVLEGGAGVGLYLVAGLEKLLNEEGLDVGILKTFPIISRQSGEHAERSEERRVGKECRSRWSPYH